MPHAKILTKQALYTLSQLLAGKLSANQRETKRLRLAIFQVEAVMKMLSPEVNIRLIAPKRRNVGNPWFKRGTLYRAVIDLLRKATGPMTGRGTYRQGCARPASDRADPGTLGSNCRPNRDAARPSQEATRPRSRSAARHQRQCAGRSWRTGHEASSSGPAPTCAGVIRSAFVSSTN